MLDSPGFATVFWGAGEGEFEDFLQKLRVFITPAFLFRKKGVPWKNRSLNIPANGLSG